MRLILLSGIITLLQVVGFAQEQSEMQTLLPFFQSEASAYEIETSDGEKCAATDKPLQSWTAGKYSGAVFVWTGPSRPAMIGCMLTHKTGNKKFEVMHELQSLSTAPLPDINVRNVRVFAPEKPGIVFHEASSKLGVSPNRVLRLRQMRNLASESEMTLTGDSRVVLRQLTTPIYRYPNRDENVIDGAIFAFVGSLGTDPEGLCIVEAIQDADRNRSWRIGFARFTWRSMEAKFRDSTVWSVEQDHGFWKARRVTSNYISGKVVDLDEQEIAEQTSTDQVSPSDSEE